MRTHLPACVAILATTAGCGLAVGIEDTRLVGPTLAGLTVSAGELEPAFDPDTTTYTLDLPLATASLVIGAAPDDDDTIVTVAGIAIARDGASAPQPLAIGPSSITVAATAAGVTRSYRIDVDRGAALAAALLAKADHPTAGDGFGAAVALDGDTLAVGAPGEDSSATGVGGDQDDEACPDSGAVYVYRRTGGAWTLDGYLKSPEPDPGDAFGQALALDGDLLVIGAPGEDSAATGVDGDGSDDSATDAGAAYVYRRGAGGWRLEAFVKASNTRAGDGFGSAVAADGATVAIGAPLEDSAATGVDGADAGAQAGSAGAVYVIARAGATWSQQAYVKASNTGAGDRFGAALALAGNRLAVGAPREDSRSPTDQADNQARDAGAVYLFTRAGAAWQQERYLKAAVIGAEDGFGAAVALSGDRLAIGAPGDDSAPAAIDGDPDDGSAADAGAVGVFALEGGAWAARAYVKAPTGGAGDQFGAAVALDESLGAPVLVVAAPLADAGGAGAVRVDAGAAHVFVETGGGWRAIARLDGDGAADGVAAVAAAGARVVLGMPGEDSGAGGVDPISDEAATDSGAVRAFE